MVTKYKRNKISFLLLEQLFKQVMKKAGSSVSFAQSDFMNEVKTAAQEVKGVSPTEKNDVVEMLINRAVQ